jgi:Protein of unknown function (DUF1588)/Protein of unknown function (DUF1592)/Protein of unknown function (DUF1585)/Protein of unknown function (DUF1595)
MALISIVSILTMPTQLMTRARRLLLSLIVVTAGDCAMADDNFGKVLLPTITQHCVKCHGKDKVKGKVNLYEIKSAPQLLAKPSLIKKMIEAVDAADMPPEDEPPLDGKKRAELVTALKVMLRASAPGPESVRNQISRLNRFQYNNSIRDLFRLNANVFKLPEQLMTRHENYLASAASRMPDRVNVACHSLEDDGGFRGVQAYPKDLRAQHGFDNQANQLTLSPLLLETFLKLSVSILDSPDFNEKTVGIWNDFFRGPAAAVPMKDEVRKRLRPFLEKAFRVPVDDPTLDRYADYTLSKIDQGLPFTECMKKVASAVLCSPKFLYRAAGTTGDQFALASRLSFFLWGSGPDEQLLALAASGELSKPQVLGKTIERMIADPKTERFLDAFPAQWMQLENILASVPDPNKHRYFRLDKNNPASLQMVLEPLLLFDAVFIEDRPIVELIAPSFSYRSDFLRTWYTSDLKPPNIDAARIAEFNRAIDEQRRSLEQTIQATRAELDAIAAPVRARLLAERKKEAISEKELLEALTPQQQATRAALSGTLKQSEAALKKLPKPLDPRDEQQEAQKRFENEVRNQVRSRVFQRVPMSDPRYGGVITNAAIMTMTSSPQRTLPIARGAWVIEVILNDPPPPPPNNVPPLNEDSGPQNLTIRERFAKHRTNPDCAGCHARIDPLGFALENFDITGRWRNRYENGRNVDASGVLFRKHQFDGVIQFKASLVQEKQRFAKAFTEHLLRFALSRELEPADALTVDQIIRNTKQDDYRIRSILRHVILSDAFLQLE